MFIMDTHRYANFFPMQDRPCRSGNLQWEQAISCTACAHGQKRAELTDSESFWHIEFNAPAGVELERALAIVEQGVAVTNEKDPHKAADLSEWEAQYDFIAHMHSDF